MFKKNYDIQIDKADMEKVVDGIARAGVQIMGIETLDFNTNRVQIDVRGTKKNYYKAITNVERVAKHCCGYSL